MTFYEAAVEVLRRTGRPLHFKKITEVAIRDELLSHVGKTPEVTMESLLDKEVKKDDSSWIVMTRPGVYMLKEEALERLNAEAKKREEKRRKREAEKRAQQEAEKAEEAQEEEADESGEDRGGSRRRRRRRSKNDRGKSNKRRSRGNGRKNKKKKRRKSSKPSVSLDELDGERFDSIADAAYAVLRASSRDPMSAEDIAEIVFDKKLVRFHTHDPEATIQSAIVTDNQVRIRRGHRPLFTQYREGRWGLTEWGVSDEGIDKEQDILELAEELRQESVEQLGEAVAGLKEEAFEMVVMTLLERLEYSNLKVSKRTSDGDVFFTADWRRGFSDLRVCIHIIADPDSNLANEEIRELRETLNHYSASEGVVITMGDVSKAAVKESRKDDCAKVTIIDRDAFVKLLADEGIGVKTYQTPIVMVDRAFIDALQR
jgi:hypothetical protein